MFQKIELKDVDTKKYFENIFNISDINDKTFIKNPFRNDNNPTCRFSFYNNQWRFMDGGWEAGKVSYNIVDVTKKVFNLSTSEAIQHILKQSKDLKPLKTNNNVEEKQIEINGFVQDFKLSDLKYWSKYNITEDILNFYNVYSLQYFKTSKGYNLSYTNEDPMYLYEINLGEYKIYRPFSKPKWLSTKTTTLQGYNQLPEKGNLLIITKALKDVMTLYSLGYNAVAPSSETSRILILGELEDRFDNIIVLYDNDKTGREKANLFFNYPKFFCENHKDISDFALANLSEAKLFLECITRF